MVMSSSTTPVSLTLVWTEGNKLCCKGSSLGFSRAMIIIRRFSARASLECPQVLAAASHSLAAISAGVITGLHCLPGLATVKPLVFPFSKYLRNYFKTL